MDMTYGDSETVLRRLDPDADLPKLVRLRAEIEAYDQLGTDTSAAVLRGQFEWPDHDPAQDRLAIPSC
jgi:hypothetical protein